MTNPKNKSPSTPHRPSQGNRDFRNRIKREDQSRDSQRGSPRQLTGLPDAQPGIILKAGREKSLLRRHPWIFSGAVESINGTPSNGDTLPVVSDQGKFIAWAAYNSSVQIECVTPSM